MDRKNDPPDRVYGRKGPFRGSPSIFWRLALGSRAVLLVMIGVALYALVQRRQLSTLSTEIVSIDYPAIETAERLLASLFAQHASEEKYPAVHDKVFLGNFDEEAREFRRALATLLALDRAAERRAALQQVQRLHNEYQTLFRGEPDQHTVLQLGPALDYAVRRDRLITKMTNALQGYVRQHEAGIGTLVTEARSRAFDAKVMTERLVVLSAVFSPALAGAASYSILRPLHRLREHIRAIGQGDFGPSVQIPAPADLQDLVETVKRKEP
ncbi:HAMP domain-containing protein [Nitrospira sp. Kam-Ns4a]